MYQIIFVIVISIVLLSGCGSNYYTEADLGSRENYYKYLSFLEGDDVEIVFLNDDTEKATIIKFYPDSFFGFIVPI